MRQIKRGVFVKKRQKKPPCARGRGGEGAAGGPGRCAGICGGAGCAVVRRGGFHIRPGRLRCRGVRRDEGIPPYGRLGGGGRPGLARSTKFIRRGGIYPTRGRLRRRGVRRDEGIPPYERPGGRGHPVWPETQNSFVGAGFTAPAGAFRRPTAAQRRLLGRRSRPRAFAPARGAAGWGIPPYERPGGWRPSRFGPKHKIHS